MTTCYVVAEGPSDDVFFSTILADVTQAGDIKIVHAGGRSSAVSLARTLLTTRPARVALVVDAHATDQDRVSELREQLEGSLSYVAPFDRFGIFLAVPSMERLLFLDEVGMGEEFGDSLTPELKVRGEYEPKAVLERLFSARDRKYGPRATASLLERLDLDRLREAPVIRDLMRFLVDVPQGVAAK